MEINNQFVKPDMSVSQNVNYIALAVLQLGGNEVPTEQDIEKIEQRLRTILKNV